MNYGSLGLAAVTHVQRVAAAVVVVAATAIYAYMRRRKKYAPSSKLELVICGDPSIELATLARRVTAATVVHMNNPAVGHAQRLVVKALTTNAAAQQLRKVVGVQ